MRQHQSILEFKHGRYLKLALGLCAVAIGVYAWHEPPTVYLKPYGGTWLGYTLGTVGAVLILWLMLLGLRKRRYRSNIGSLQGWTSAHVYLGVSLVIIATLHCAFEFGWNVHTLAYVLMMAVIASGFYGVYSYLHYPELVTKNLGDETPAMILLKITDLDRKCRRLALDLPDEINAVVGGATRAVGRELGVSVDFRQRLRAPRIKCPTRAACDALMRIDAKLTAEQAKVHQQLLTEMTRKSMLLDRLRNDMRFRALMQLWLFFHVPLSFALLAALSAHVISVFFYW